jgi:L-lysine 2,3-aminomutase
MTGTTGAGRFVTALKSVSALKRFLDLTSDELACDENDKVNLPIRITPYYASLLSHNDANASHPPFRCAGERRIIHQPGRKS